VTLDDKEKKFLANRRKVLKLFPTAGGAGFALVITYLIWAYYKTPLLINPNVVKAKLIEKTIEDSTLTLMALLLPWIMLALMLTVLALIAFAFSWLALEKKYLKIVDRVMPE